MFSRTFCCLPSHPLQRREFLDKEVHMVHLRPQRQKLLLHTPRCFCRIYLDIVIPRQQIVI